MTTIRELADDEVLRLTALAGRRGTIAINAPLTRPAPQPSPGTRVGPAERAGR